MTDWSKEYPQLRAYWRESPVVYAKQRLGLFPTQQQASLLRAIAEPEARVTVRSGHSMGKSTSMAAAILWKLECFDFSKVPCTAPSAIQLRDILWSEVSKWYRNSVATSQHDGIPQEFWLPSLFEITQDKIFARGAPREWFAVARTSRPETPDALQGFRRRRLGRPADERRKVLDAPDVILLGVLSDMPGGHVAHHALTKRADTHTQLLS